MDSPPRLFVYLARTAPLAVVLRRGPSDWARLSLWHTDTDLVEHGQWIKGRVYERRSDLSADGSLFVAFVRQSGGHPGADVKTDTWVAVSRPPYFTALALWAIGGTYHTGGFFPSERSLWVGYGSSLPDIGAVPRWLQIAPPREIPYIDGSNDWTERTVHFNRLLRDGWKRLEDGQYRTKWQHRHPALGRTLLMTQQFTSFDDYGGPYLVDYAVHDDATDQATELGAATWADWDHRGRLVLAREGTLVTWSANEGFAELADFRDQTPDPQPAPPWAKEWPEEP